MAVLPKRSRLLALMWLAVALWLVAMSGRGGALAQDPVPGYGSRHLPQPKPVPGYGSRSLPKPKPAPTYGYLTGESGEFTVLLVLLLSYFFRF